MRCDLGNVTPSPSPVIRSNTSAISIRFMPGSVRSVLRRSIRGAGFVAGGKGDHAKARIREGTLGGCEAWLDSHTKSRRLLVVSEYVAVSALLIFAQAM